VRADEAQNPDNKDESTKYRNEVVFDKIAG
jgi:hypothetical protein